MRALEGVWHDDRDTDGMRGAGGRNVGRPEARPSYESTTPRVVTPGELLCYPYWPDNREALSLNYLCPTVYLMTPEKISMSTRGAFLRVLSSYVACVLGLLVLAGGMRESARAQSVSFAGALTPLNVVNGGGGIVSSAGVALGGEGQVYVADAAHDRVVALGAGGARNTVGRGLRFPYGVAVDGAGNVYIADTGNQRVVEVPADGGEQRTVASGLRFPTGVTVNGSGNVVITESFFTRATEFQRGSVDFHGVSACGFGTTVPAGCAETVALNYNVTASGTLGSVRVLTQGTPNLDFTLAAGSTCSGFVTVGSSCTVNVQFGPGFAGTRNGAVEVLDASGNLLARTYIRGTGMGAQVAFGPSSQVGLGGGFSAPASVAVDGSGNLFVADNGAVKEAPAGCVSSSCVTTLGGGFTHAEGVAVDGAGVVYVADGTKVWEMPAGCGSSSCVTGLGGGFTQAQSVAVDGIGNVYVADAGNNAVTEMPAGCGSSSCVKALGGGFISPAGLAVDGSGNVFVGDHGNNAVKENPLGCAAGSCVTTLGGGFSGPMGVAVDGSGSVYVADNANKALKEISPGCTSSSCVTTLEGAIQDPVGVALDAAGNLNIADGTLGAIQQAGRAAPPALTFALTVGGHTSSDSPKTVQVENIGNLPLGFPSLSAGSNPSVARNFSIVSGSSPACPLVASASPGAALAEGAGCGLSISFTPGAGATGTVRGMVVLTFNSAGSGVVKQTVTLSGTAQSPPTGHLDAAYDASTNATTVGHNNTLKVDGWATDPQSSAPVASVQVLVDGTVAGTATLGIARPDVAAAYNNPAYTNSGWTFMVPAGTLPAGTHTIGAVATDSLGMSTTLNGTASIVAAALPSGSTDQAAGASSGSATIAHNDSLKVLGWAANPPTGILVNQVQVLVDGTAVGTATLGQPRPDVATTLNSAVYTNSGWIFTMAAGGIAVGAHTVTAVASDPYGDSVALPGSISITVTPAPPIGYIDAALNPGTGLTTVRQTDSLEAEGWAANPPDGILITQVQVMVDGKAFGTATLGLPRADIAKAQGSAAYTNSGWSFTGPASGLTVGSHTVTAVATDSTGVSKALTGAQSITVAAGTVIPATIKHVVVIMQENRSFDNLFMGFPGADTVTSGPDLGTTVPLKPVPFEDGHDADHTHTGFLGDLHGGKMDGFARSDYPTPDYGYAYVPQSETIPYWTLAQRFTIGDRMFASNSGPSFVAHQYMIAGQSGDSDENPTFAPWGCDAPASNRVQQIGPNGTNLPGVYPCFDYQTIADEMDTAGVTWKYYAPGSSPAILSNKGFEGGFVWSAFQAIKHIRFGADWTNNVISPSSQVLTDIGNGQLAQMTWITPAYTYSDHPGPGATANGPDWVASITNAIGASQYWDSTVIFVSWDDWGGWYDHVVPPSVDNMGLGFRVPVIVVSPYAKAGYVSHTTHEFGGFLKYAEEAFNLPSLGTRDAISDDFSDCFDYTRPPIPYVPIPVAHPGPFFVKSKDTQPGDDD